MDETEVGPRYWHIKTCLESLQSLNQSSSSQIFLSCQVFLLVPPSASRSQPKTWLAVISIHESSDGDNLTNLPGAAFYNAVFNWTFAPSSLGFPADKLQTFEVPGGILPIGGAMRRVEDIPAGSGSSKLYLYVHDIVASLEVGGLFIGRKAVYANLL